MSNRDPIRLKAADVMHRARPSYVVYTTAIILGLVGGLWAGSRVASVSSPTTSQAPPAAETTVSFTKTGSTVRVAEPPAGDMKSTPGGVDNPSHAATPVIAGERAPRHVPPADEARSPKEPRANASAAPVEPHAGQAAAGSYVSAGREPERRQGGGPCRLLVSERSLSLRAGGGSGTITVSSQGVDGPARVTATTKNWPDVVVFPELRGNPGGPVKYSVISVSKRAGTYAVNFQSPCGTKTVPVTIRQP